MNSFSTFELGRVVLTYGISEALHDNPLFEEEIMGAFIRYCVRDWSDMEHQEDKDMNDEALASGEGRILASYQTSQGKIFIITEWDRSYTTIMFAEEY